MRSSSVRTQAGGGGSSAGRAEGVDLLSMVMLLEADAPKLAEAGGDRDTSPGRGRCTRGRIVAELSQPRIGT